MNTQKVDRQSIEEATQEAANRSLDFDPVERAALIRRMLNEIPRAVAAGMTADDLGLQHGFKQGPPSATDPPVNPRYAHIKEFADRYPELFKKIVGQQDLAPIRQMLVMLDKISEGKLSTHQASVIVGQKLVDRYVTPQLKGHGRDGQGR